MRASQAGDSWPPGPGGKAPSLDESGDEGDGEGRLREGAAAGGTDASWVPREESDWAENDPPRVLATWPRFRCNIFFLEKNAKKTLTLGLIKRLQILGDRKEGTPPKNQNAKKFHTLRKCRGGTHWSFF